MLVSYLPGKDFNLTISIPFIQILYPPPPPPPPPPQKDLSVLVTTSVCAAGSILLFLFLVGFLYHYFTKTRPSSTVSVAFGDTNREENEDERDERDFSDIHHVWRINTVGLHRSTIDSITVVLFKKEEGIIDGTECSICLNEFEEDESLRLLPKCSHAFHINCIDTWLLSHRNCPLCRAPVLLHTDPTHQVTEVNHLQDTGSRNGLSGGQVRSESRNSNILPRAQSDLSNHCGVGRIEYVRRPYSVGESLSLCDGDNIATRSRCHFPTRLSTYFSSSRRSRNNDQVLPNQMPNLSGSTS